MGTMQGKVAWITGGGTGIGFAAAQALAQAGVTVILSGRRVDVLEHAVEQIRSNGGTAAAVPVDVSQATVVERVVADIIERHGKIDILVNSAGINTPQRHWRDQSVDGWDRIVGINLDGTFYCIRAVLPSMRSRKEGLVINISSWAGRYTSPVMGVAYNGSKHAINVLTETINMEECANGIRACVICPAEVATPVVDRRPVPVSAAERARMLQPEDLGETIRFIAELPPRVCINEIVMSPTWNRVYLGGHRG